MFISQICSVPFSMFLAPRVLTNLLAIIFNHFFLCPILFLKGFVSLCCPSMAHAIHWNTPKLKKQWRNFFSAQYIPLSRPSNPVFIKLFSDEGFTWYKLFYHPKKQKSVILSATWYLILAFLKETMYYLLFVYLFLIVVII